MPTSHACVWDLFFYTPTLSIIKLIIYLTLVKQEKKEVHVQQLALESNLWLFQHKRVAGLIAWTKRSSDLGYVNMVGGAIPILRVVLHCAPWHGHPSQSLSPLGIRTLNPGSLSARQGFSLVLYLVQGKIYGITGEGRMAAARSGIKLGSFQNQWNSQTIRVTVGHLKPNMYINQTIPQH